MKRFISAFIIIAVLMSCCACSKGKAATPVTLKNGETVQLLASDIYQALGDDAKVEWSSSDETVVTVELGKVSYVKEGTAVVTAKGSSADGKKTHSLEFNVKCLSSDGAVKLDKYSLKLNNDGDSVTLSATVTDSADKIKRWSSSDEGVATVENGKITRVSDGKAEITVETQLGYKATCYVICDKVVMKLGEIEITDSMFSYWISSYKTQFVEYNIGEDSPEIWETEIDEEGTTFQSVFMSEIVTSSVRQMLESVYVYYQTNDTVSKEITDSVDEQINAAIESNGGKEAFDLLLSRFYADTDLLREIFLFEEITNHVYEGLFGENGTEKLTDDAIKEYFYDNYAKAQHVFFDLQYKFDDEGNYSYLSETEKENKRVLADEVWTKIQNGELDYDAAVKEYSDDMEDTYDGFVFTEGEYDDGFTECVNGMKIGELKNYESSYGIHLIKRVELSDEDIDDDVRYIIEEMLTMQKFDEKLAEHGEKIEVMADLDAYDVASIPMFSSVE